MWEIQLAPVPVNADNGDRETSAEDDRIAVTFEQKGRRPAGTQDKSCQIVQAANAANQAIGMETLYIGAASTDANIPISLGIPAITVGWGRKRRWRAYHPRMVRTCRILERTTA